MQPKARSNAGLNALGLLLAFVGAEKSPFADPESSTALGILFDEALATVTPEQRIGLGVVLSDGSPGHLHHADPKFMGGDPAQPLTTMAVPEHQSLHKDLNDYLVTQTDGFGNHMRPQRGNPGAAIRANFTRNERLQALATFYRQNAAKYVEAAWSFFSQHPGLW